MPGSAQREFLDYLDGHGAALMGMLRRLCRNRHDADDVFQDAALRIWRGFGSRPILRNPRGWIMTIGYRAFIDSRSRRNPLLEEAHDPADPRSQSPLDAAKDAEACDQVQAAINELSDPIREVVVLHYVSGLSLSQTAAAMGISEGTVKSRLSSALAKLRSVLQ